MVFTKKRKLWLHFDPKSIVSGPPDFAFLPINQPRMPDAPMSNGTPSPTPTPTPSFHWSYISFLPAFFCVIRNDSTCGDGMKKNCDLSSEMDWPSLETARLGLEIMIWLLGSWATSQLAMAGVISGARSVGKSPRRAVGLNAKEDMDPVTSFAVVLRNCQQIWSSNRDTVSPGLALQTHMR